MEQHGSRAQNQIAFLVFAALVLGLVLIPVLSVISRSDSTNLTNPLVLHIVEITFVQALVSTALSGVIGLLCGLWIGKFPSRFAFSALAVPYGIPAVVAATAWVHWLGKNGALGSLEWSYSMKAVVLAHVFFNAPFVALLVAQSRKAIPASCIEVARTLGAGEIALFKTVIWPEVSDALWNSCAQAFALCVMSFALVLILGGGPPVQTLEVALYAFVRGGWLDLSAASACGVWELVLTLVPWLIWMTLRDSRSLRIGSDKRSLRPKSREKEWISSALALVWILPYAVIATASWRILSWEELQYPLKISLVIAFFSACGALGWGTLAVWLIRRMPSRAFVIESAILLPGGISILVLGLGFFLAYRRWIDPFTGSLSAMIFLQTTLFVPIAFRILSARARKISNAPPEAARTLGATALRAFWDCEWPQWRAPAVTAFALVVGASLGEIAAVSLFASEKLLPLPLLLSSFMAHYRFEEAQALSAVLLILSAGAIFGVSWGTNRWGDEWNR